MTTPNCPPPKPKGQGGKAPADVQPVNAWEKNASNTGGFDAVGPGGGAQDHAGRKNPGGFGGSRKK